MYIFYGDESGFSKGSKLEKDQPLTVFCGILIDLTKLNKAAEVHKSILDDLNSQNAQGVITELKFNDIKKGKGPIRKTYSRVADRADLLEEIVSKFLNEISLKVFYTAIDDENFINTKKAGNKYSKIFQHSYICAVYSTVSTIDIIQSTKKGNKGKTFLILDEQNKFQENIENLINKPLHLDSFDQIFDTAYFGKSHYSRLIQISDLFAGIIRYYFYRKHYAKKSEYWFERVETLMKKISDRVLTRNCFKNELSNFYDKVEIKKPQF